MRKNRILMKSQKLKMKNSILLILLGLMCSISVQSQDIKATEVRVTEGFKPSIPEANKLNEQASFADTLKVHKSQTYSAGQFNLKTNYKTRPLKAAKVKDESIPKLYGNQASIGFGDNWNKRFSFSHNSKRSIDFNYGLFLQHISNQYKPQNYQVKNSQNVFNVYGKNQNSKGDYAAVIPKFIKSAKKNQILYLHNNGSQTRDFVHVKDIVKALILTIPTKSDLTVNIGSGKSITIRNLAKMIILLRGN